MALALVLFDKQSYGFQVWKVTIRYMRVDEQKVDRTESCRNYLPKSSGFVAGRELWLTTVFKTFYANGFFLLV